MSCNDRRSAMRRRRKVGIAQLPISKHKRRRRGTQHRPALEQRKLRPLLYTRAQAAALLNRSVATIRRLEQRGVLKGRRLGEKGAVMLGAGDVHALAGITE